MAAYNGSVGSLSAAFSPPLGYPAATGLAPPMTTGPMGGGLVGGLPLVPPVSVYASYPSYHGGAHHGAFNTALTSAGGGVGFPTGVGFPLWLGQAPPPPSSALSAPANLQPVRAALSKPRKQPSGSNLTNLTNLNPVGGAPPPRPPSVASSRGGRRSGAADGSAAHAYTAQAYAAQDAERQRQHLQQLDLRQQQALHRLGAGGGAYDRLSAAGMPLP
jgi:hypothetical protein